MFVSANIQDYDLQPLLFMIIQIINGVAVLFAGPRYLPLRIKCIQWLNHLSSSSGIFIPVASLVLDILEYKISKDGAKPGKAFNQSTSVKVRNLVKKNRISAIGFCNAHQFTYQKSTIINTFKLVADIQKLYLNKNFVFGILFLLNFWYSFRSIG